MKKFLTQFGALLTAVAVVVIVPMHLTHASLASEAAAGIFGIDNISTFVTNMTANIVSTVFLTVASWFVSLAGTLLNVGMYFTTHLGLFIENSPVIYEVWSTIRDISSLVLIFFILWAAIQMILDIRPANYGELIKNIIIMGILINFSFFFTRVLIDASNIVSLEFYNAIAPQNTASLQCDSSNSSSSNSCTNISNVTKRILTSGGLANIMMGSFKATAWYNTKGQLQDAKAGGKIILLGFAGTVVMLMVSFSLLAAAVACIVRLAMLIFLLGFSPLWIASWAVPQLKEFSKNWTKQLQTQLVFLPVYLGMMYVALKIITGSHLNDLTDINTATGIELASFINLFVGFVIIFFLINMPLFVAVQVSGGMKWTEKMYAGMRGALTSAMGRQTLGRAAASFNKKAENAKVPTAIKPIAGLFGVGNSAIAKDVRAGTTDKLISSKFGGARSFKDAATLSKEIGKKDAELQRRSQFNKALELYKADPLLGGAAIKTSLDKMSSTEKLDLGKDILKKPEVLMHLSKSDFSALDKAADDKFSDSDKEAIGKSRMDALRTAVANSFAGTDKQTLEHMIDNMSGEDLMKAIKEDKSTILNADAISHLSENQIKYMKENKLSDDNKRDLFNTVQIQFGNTGKKHSAAGWMFKNKSEWVT